MTIDKLLQTDQPVYDTGFSDADIQIIGSTNIISTTTPKVALNYEVNIYSFNGLLLNSFVNNSFSTLTTSGSVKYLNIPNFNKYFDQSNLNSGKYYYTVNSYTNKFDNLFIQEISSTRTEIKLGRKILPVTNTATGTTGTADFDPNNMIMKDNVFATTSSNATPGPIITRSQFVQFLTTGTNFNNLYVNFGQDRFIRIINIDLGPAPAYDILVKLYEPLPIGLEIKQLCQIDDVVFRYGDIAEYTQNIEIIDPSVLIQPPNFNIDLDIFKGATTGFQTWNDLLNVNLSTSQQIIDTYFGQSLTGIKLNIDYSKPEQFIFYSSAEERFNNFYYKVQLLEDYNVQLTSLNNINQTIKESNIIDVAKKRNKIINGFDDFEKYLYFGTDSGSLYTFYTGSISPWPKTTTGSLNWLESYNFWVDNYTTGSLNPNTGYTLQSTKSNIVKTYAEDTLAIMLDYDRKNINSLIKTIPAALSLDDRNSEYFIFVNMIGHHFDIIYTYVNHLSSIHSREEHPLDGISKELLTTVADSFGWKLTNSKKKDSLWQYVTGLNANGNYLQSGILPTISTEQYTLEIWNRIVNNLPYLLKTKGTRRSIQALMSCYGIPSTIINIKEYGGPTVADIKPDWQVDKFLYSLEFGNSTGSVSIPWTKLYSTNRNPDSIQFRIKPDPDVVLFPRTLLRTDNIGSPFFYINYDQPSGYNSKEGQLTYYVLQSGNTYVSGTLNNVPMFNEDWTSILLTRDPLTNSTVSTNYTITAVVKKYDNIIYNSSSSFTATNLYYNSSSNILIGSASYSASNKAFDGNMSEFRYWSYTLNNASMVEYTKNPLFYGGNADPDAFTYLDFRAPFSYLTDITGSYPSVHPDQGRASFSGSIASNATLSGFIATDLGSEDYTTYVAVPSLGSDNIMSQKIRLINNSLSAALDPTISSEVKTSEQTPKDTNVVSIYLSPQEIVNADIYNQLGYFDMDDYIGDPGDQNNSYYTDLRTIQFQYWKKYKNKNSMPLLLKLLSVYDYSFFDQLKQLLPARVILDNSIVIKQNVLERNKFIINDDVIASTPMYNSLIDIHKNVKLTGEYPVHSASIDYTETLNNAGVYNYSSSKYIAGTGVVPMMVRFEPTGAVILQNALSKTRQVFYPIYDSAYSASISKYNPLSSSYRAAEVQDYIYESKAYKNSRFDGTKISAPGYNVGSNDLPDKSPVIIITRVTPGVVRRNPAIPPTGLPPQNIGPVQSANPAAGTRATTPSILPVTNTPLPTSPVRSATPSTLPVSNPTLLPTSPARSDAPSTLPTSPAPRTNLNRRVQ